MKAINCTPHVIRFNDGMFIEPSGNIARVNSTHRSTGLNAVVRECAGGIDDHEHRVYCGCPEEGQGFVEPIFTQVFGEIVGLPEEEKGVVYVVSSMVVAAAKAIGRWDCMAPATGHNLCVRDEKGHIVSVPGLVR